MKLNLKNLIGLMLLVAFALYAYGCQTGQSYGQKGAGKVAAGIMALSLNPISRQGFVDGYYIGQEEFTANQQWQKENMIPWTFYERKDDITDEKSLHLSVTSDEGDNVYDPSLIIMCHPERSKLMTVAINSGSYLSADNWRKRDISVAYRVDEDKAVRGNWTLSKNNEILYFQGNVKDFIAQLYDKKTFKVRFGERTQHSASFPIRGLREKVEPLLDACR